ncbi:MAG: hydroxyacid dehydrogenase [Anaerolineae bacterium]|nr:MAG: hydroxyacid dehydrogenase [Anaerolineae bacterium]
MRKDDLLARLPPEWPESDLRARIRQATSASGRRVVVMDDDPTGTQTVHSLPVLTEWTPEALAAAWDEADTTFYVLTNSRRYPLAQARAMNQEIARHLAAVARGRGAEPVVVSRSDSTLRGHYPGEVAALRGALEAELGFGYDGLVIVPFFLEGGRLTVDDVHWVREGEELTPAAQTEFARDPTFGYRHSNLREWVAEKTGGQVPASAVLSVGLADIRQGGPDAVADLLAQAQGGRVIVANAVTYRDLEVFVWGLMQAEGRGKRFLFRTAASFVKVRGGIPYQGLLTFEELLPAGHESGVGGLTIVGSYVERTTAQLNQALALEGTLGLELPVAQVLAEGSRRETIDRALGRVEAGLRQGWDVILYTSRELVVPAGLSQLDVAQHVSQALVAVLCGLSVRPAYLIGKGGITSSDLATDGLAVRQAQVLGQIVPGVPVWRLGGESKYPGLPYVVFPGNVGGPDALAGAIRILRGEEG